MPRPADALDRAAPVRAGEALDVEKLSAYLETQLGWSGPLEVAQFPSGYSNLTYLVRAGERQLVLRRPPFGTQIQTAHDMAREHRILSALWGVYPKVPKPLTFCDDEAVLGAPFYAMERVPGVVLRKAAPDGLDLDAAAMRALSERFVDNLAALHALDVAEAGLGELGRPEGYVRRQIEGWTRRYRNAKTDEVPEVEAAARWLAEHRPPESGAALIHNDYKYDNLVLDPATLEIKAVLDWEMATLGDPLMDLGTSLAYWVDPDDPPELQSLRFCLTTLPGNLDRAGLVERYARASGRDPGGALFYYVYGVFKLIVIVQQIYARYLAGHSQDARFAGLGQGVHALGRVARRALERGRIDRL